MDPNRAVFRRAVAGGLSEDGDADLPFSKGIRFA
jgi:hypothetical protein